MIVRDVDRPDATAIEAPSDINPNDIGRHFHFGFASPEIEFMQTITEVNLVGSVVIVRIPPEDSTMVHKVTGLAQPGDVIVVDMGSHTTNAPWDELTTRAVQASGVIGAVIDGSITDTRAIERLEFPVYARGRSPRTTRLHGRGGDINVDVQVGNTVVSPGDVVIGNRDGVLFVPQDRLDAAIELTEGVDAHEERIFEGLPAGESLADLIDANDLIEAMEE